MNKRLSVFKKFDWPRHFKENFLIVIASILFGTATHIVWDNFTHENGQFVQNMDGLQNHINIVGYSVPVYKMLQHASTVIGGLIIIYALLQIPKYKSTVKQKTMFHFWLIVSVVTLLIVGGRLITGLDFRQYGNVIVTMITGGLVGLVLASALINFNFTTSLTTNQKD